MINPAPNPKLGHRICLDLGSAIVQGQFASSQQLPTEHEICALYKVSRTAVREAIKMLTAKGLVNSRTRQGTIVSEQSQWNLLDPDIMRWLQKGHFSFPLMLEFTQMRLAIEPQAAGIVATNYLLTDLEPIEAALRRMEAAEQGLDDPLETDIAFHASILKATGNRFFEQLSPLVQTALHFSIQLTNSQKGVSIADIAQHRQVYEFIAKGQTAKARRAMREMLDEVMSLIKQAQQKQDF